MRRVVVTGLGLVTPLGCGVKPSWEGITSSRSGLVGITHCDVSDLPAKVAGQVVRGTGDNEFNADKYIEPKEQKKMDHFIHFAFGAAHEAAEDAGITSLGDEDKLRTGVMIGSGIGGLRVIEETVLMMKDRGARRVSPFFIPAALINLASGQISIKYGFKGPNHSVVTACSTGAHAIGDASRLIQFGDADIMLAGGAEATICRIGLAGFAAARALSTGYNETPTKASRPWDKGRDGFVMGEGAGVVVLEEYEHAKKRGAKIYAEIVGYGLSGDAHHITAPAPEHEGAGRAMKSALERAKMNPEDIDYINAHGTSTPLGDELELQAVKNLFGEAAYKLSMSSTKSAIGHLLGAAGAVESIFSILAMRDQIAPPTLNLDEPSEGCDLDLVAHKAKEREIRAVLSNSFGFGGTNSSLIFKKI
ncbi:MAG: beta-ketoacyl-ACP synthase II [Rickettsiales bacterium]